MLPAAWPLSRDRRVVSPGQTRPGTGVRAAAYGERVLVTDVPAGVLAVGDVVRVDDPQGHRVERIVAVAGEGVTLEMRRVGLAADAPVRVTLVWGAVVECLGSTEH
jgi:hypothetical protein